MADYGHELGKFMCSPGGEALLELLSKRKLYHSGNIFGMNHTGAVSYTHLTLPTICSV